MAITVMRRYEMKYLLSGAQTEFLRRRLEGHMRLDEYGRTSVASLYYDTPDARLIRASLEKPVFKEKLRLRSYGLASEDSPVYLELKRKYDGVVSKRRIRTPEDGARRFFGGGDLADGDAQIRRELTFTRDHYRTLAPACLVIYDREAYFEPGGDLRLTIDFRPRYRTEDLTLTSSMAGRPLLDEGWTVLELKVQDAVPLWLCSILGEGRIRKSGFSKYGEAYLRQLAEQTPAAIPFPAPAFPGVA